MTQRYDVYTINASICFLARSDTDFYPSHTLLEKSFFVIDRNYCLIISLIYLSFCFVLQAIRRTVDKKTVELYNIFKYVLQTIQSIISTSSIPHSLERFHPQYAGSAFWARSLKRRIERMMSFLNMAHFLPNVGISVDIRQQYEYVKQALDDFIQRQYKEWSYHIENEPTKKLECPLIKRVNDEGYLQANFEPSLIKLLQEIKFWERLGFEIPSYASEILTRKVELRTAREKCDVNCT